MKKIPEPIEASAGVAHSSASGNATADVNADGTSAVTAEVIADVTAAVAGTVTVPVTREEIDVTTRVVDTGRGVRVTRKVIEQPAEIREQLWHEELDVQRVPVDRVVAEAPPSRYEGDVLVVPVLEEILVIEKRFRIKEELRITRVRKQQEYRDTVPLRVEDVQVEAFDDTAANGVPSPNQVI